MKPIKPKRGASSEAILALTDLGLKPLIVATAMSMTVQNVYTTLKKAGRITGDGRKGEILRKEIRTEGGLVAAQEYLNRVFFDAADLVILMFAIGGAYSRGQASMTPAATPAVPQTLPVVKRGRGRPRKNPVPVEPIVVKRGPGRPRKAPLNGASYPANAIGIRG